MALFDRARGLYERISGFQIDRRTARKQRQLMEKYGYSIISSWDEVPEFLPIRGDIDRVMRSGRLEYVEPILARTRDTGIVLANGRALHHYAWDYFQSRFHHSDGGPECEARLPPFRDSWERCRTAFTAALYADALSSTAHAYRGGSFADQVTDAQWAQHFKHLSLGRSVLNETEASAGESPIWHEINYDYGLQDPIDDDAFIGRFERAWSLDRYNMSLCVNHGIRLLPRWRGNDARDLEDFARRAAALTQDRFGWGLYAHIYWGQTGIGTHEPGDTLCDPELLKRGFEDLAERFPAQSILNNYAATMSWIEDQPACFALFDRRMRTIVLGSWEGDSDAECLEDALDALFLALPEDEW